MRVIVLGTLALDTVKTPYAKANDILGGSAVYFALAARFFTRVNLVSIVGYDFPKKYIDFLKRKDIVLSSVQLSRGSSFRWKAEYKKDLNQAITLETKLGVLSNFKPTIVKSESRIKYIFLANLDPDIQSHLLKNMYSPKMVGLDSMNFWIRNKRKSLLRILKQADIYLANDAEARELTQESNLFRAAKLLKKIGPPMIIIKKGEHGVLFYCDKFIFHLPAYPVYKTVDPTGAGDTFAGGFMGYLANKNRLSYDDIKRAIAYGVVLASFSV